MDIEQWVETGERVAYAEGLREELSSGSECTHFSSLYFSWREVFDYGILDKVMREKWVFRDITKFEDNIFEVLWSITCESVGKKWC